MDINATFQIGRLTRDCDFKYASTGAAVMEFTIAVNHRKGKDGVEPVSYFTVKIFGKLAESLKDFMKKGKQVGVKGYLKQDRWEKDGEKRERVVIMCEEIEMLDKGNSNQGSSSYGNTDDYGYGN